jgi:hypothetical protein
VPLTWPEYLEIEKNLLACWQDQSKNLQNRFLDGSAYLNVLLAEKTGKQLSQSVSSQGTLNAWDKILIATLYRTYFPRQTYRVKGYGKQNLHLGSFLTTMMSGLFTNDVFGESSKLPWPENDQEINDLIYRFVYSHIFAKLYFGAGFGQLSLIAGFHHLALGLVLIKLKARALAMSRQQCSITMADVVTTVVQLEKGLGEVKISPYGAAILELLLASESRLRRCFAFGAG